MAEGAADGPPPAGLDPTGVRLLLEVSRRINAEVSPDAVLEAVVDSLVRITGADRGILMLRDEDGELQFAIARDREGRPLEERTLRISRGVVDEVAASGEIRLIDDASNADAFQSRMSVIQLRLRTVLCAPLRTPRGVVGVVYVDSNLLTRRFTPQDVPLVEAFAAQASAAIERVRLQRAEMERDRMRRELEVASEIQRAFLPSAFPPVEGVRGAVRAIPAREVGGDVYEVAPLDDGRLLLFVGDVAGKGVPGALFGARLLSDLRHRVRGGGDAGEVLAAANRSVHARATRGMFVTAWLALLDVATGQLDFANAGHPPALVRRRDGRLETLAEPSGLVLGVLEDVTHETGRTVLEPGDLLVVVTDGLTDATDARGERFGDERLRDALAGAPADPEALVAHVLASVALHAGAEPADDDRTLLAVMRTG